MRRSGLAFLLLVLGIGFPACEDEPTSTRTVELPTGREGLPTTPDQVVEDGEHVITVDGVKKAVIEAEQMYFFHELGRVIGDTISVRFFDESGIQQSLLTARTGEIQQESQEMLAEGQVHVRGETARITTERLRYHPDRNLVTSDTTTEIHQDGNVIRGQGVESDPGLRNLRIRGASAVIRNETPLRGPADADTTETSDDVGGATGRDEPAVGAPDSVVAGRSAGDLVAEAASPDEGPGAPPEDAGDAPADPSGGTAAGDTL